MFTDSKLAYLNAITAQTKQTSQPDSMSEATNVRNSALCFSNCANVSAITQNSMSWMIRQGRIDLMFSMR